MMRSLRAIIASLPKRTRFLVFLGTAGLVASIVSFSVWLGVYREPTRKPVAVAVVAPFSGPDAALGKAILDGARSWTASRDGSRAGRPIILRSFDTAALPDAREQAASDPDVAAIMEPPSRLPEPADASRAAALPRVLLAAGSSEVAPGAFPVSPSAAQEVRFLANYVRNIIGEKLISIILPDTPDQAELAGQFDETLQRFGTRVVYRWAVPPAAETRGAPLLQISNEITDRQIAGTILILGPPDFAAEAMAALAETQVANRIIGTRAMATNEFRKHLRAIWTARTTPETVLNGTLVSTPILFDTAGVEAQAFRSAYETANAVSPDWVSVLAHDGMRALGAAVASATSSGREAGEALRPRLGEALAAMRSVDTGVAGLAGPIFFESRGSALPVLVGRYNGMTLVSAPVQLSPIRDQGVSDYLDQLRSGRMLYVNDRFMYRTNVVSTGLEIHKITNLNHNAGTVDLEFNLWFRWRGATAAPDIVFDNAVRPISLPAPDHSTDDEEQHYRAWRLRGQFFLNASTVRRAFGVDAVGVSFHHRALARHNLMFVPDIVGMGLTGSGAKRETKQSGWLDWLTGDKVGSASALVRQLEARNALAGAPGFVIDDAFLSQEVVPGSTNGDPQYVGFGKPEAMFSRIALDVLVKPDSIDLRSLVPNELLIYLAIFAFSGAVLAQLLDRRDRGDVWRMQTLGLRIITWPVLLATLGSVVLDEAIASGGISVAESVNLVIRSLWWIMPARLVSLSVARFVWAPLEANTGRKVPTVFRVLANVVFYAGAALGILAGVFGQSISSVLATSGLLTFIIGLAIQSNLRDIFSGIMLNIERPFVIGDKVRINGISGKVFDVSWRTTRLRASTGHVISFPNGAVVSARIENYYRADHYKLELVIHLDAGVAPERAIQIITDAVGTVTQPQCKLEAVLMSRLEHHEGSWVVRYVAEVEVAKPYLAKEARSAIWAAIWRAFTEAGLATALVPDNRDPDDPRQLESPRVESDIF